MKSKYIIAASILLFVSGFCSAATPVNLDDFTGTSWMLYGNAKVSAGIVGSMSAKGVVYVDFDSDGSSFTVTDAGGYAISGTYGVDSKGKFFVSVGIDDVQSFFDEYLGDYSDEATVTVTSAKSVCKVTYSGSTVSLAINISFKAKFDVSYEDDDGNPKEYRGTESYTLNVAGDHPVADGAPNWASKWVINNAKAALSARKVKASKVMNLELTLGDPDSGLDLNQYLLVDTDSVVLSSDMESDFCRSKNTVYFSGDESNIDTTIQNLILNNNSNVDDVEIDDTSSKLTATVKDGKTISLTGAINFSATIYYTDGTEADDVKGTLKLTGKGVPAP